jgi:rhodanese-related sulfurtransferase
VEVSEDIHFSLTPRARTIPPQALQTDKTFLLIIPFDGDFLADQLYIHWSHGPHHNCELRRVERTKTGVGRGDRYNAVMDHSPGFLKVVDEARPHVKEVTLEEARERLKTNPKAVLMDVREDSEWAKGHAAEAVHLGKGVLERDLENMVPDPSTEIIMYCGGGFRSILTAEVAQRMGYKKVASLKGGYKGLVAGGWKMTQ